MYYGILWYALNTKLSACAKHVGMTDTTASQWWKAGQLDAYQLPTGTIIVYGRRNAKRRAAQIQACVEQGVEQAETT